MLVHCTQPNLNLQARFWIEKAAETEYRFKKKNLYFIKSVLEIFLSFLPSLEY